MTSGKLKILGIAGEANAVSWYRMINPVGEYGGDLTFKLGADKDGEGDEKVVTIGSVKSHLKALGEEFFNAYDIVLVKYIARKEDAQNILYWKSKAPNTKLFLDVDDNVFEIPKGNSSKDKWGEEEQSILAHFATQCDGVICSTEPLVKYFKVLNDNVIVSPNRIKPSQWVELPKGDVIKIGWTFSKTHTPDKEAIGNALKIIKEKYPNVVIETTGSELEGTTDISGIPFLLYPKWLCERKWDIAIAPLKNNQFNKCKSNIKWLESTLAGSVFVGSNVEPYKKSIKHGVTGFLASTEQEWVEILSTLIENKSLREEVQKNAKEVVLKEYNIDINNPLKILEKGVLSATQ